MDTTRERMTPAAGANRDRMLHAWLGRFTGDLPDGRPEAGYTPL